MRTDLGFSKGRLIAQGAHAAIKIFTDRMDHTPDGLLISPRLYGVHWEAVQYWLTKSFTKLVFRTDSRQGLLDICRRAEMIFLPHALMEETQGFVEPEPTAVALCPCEEDTYSPVIQGYRLL